MIYCFVNCELDSDQHELRVGGDVRTVEPQVFDLLLYLVEHSDRMVTKDELFEHVWKGRIVSEANLSNRIGLARQAVGDDGQKQALIKTFARRGFRFVGEVVERETVDKAATESQTDTANASRSDKPSIAVLPFENMSGDPEQEYFSDGMAEDLITDLSNISDLYVAARNSSFSFKAQMPYVQEVAEKLGVRFVLEGSVRKMGDRLRVNAQLIDAADGGHRWAKRYDGNMDEIFEFQDRIRAEIVSELKPKLTAADKALTQRKPTVSVEAYDLFLKGRAIYHRYTREDMLEAKNCLEEAIEIDPNFAEAYGYLSYCLLFGWGAMWPEFGDNLDRANAVAEKGVALDGTSSVALVRLAWVQTVLRHYDQAIGNLEKAIDLAPENADVIATFGQILNYWGDPERALQMMEKAFSIEMIVPPNWEYQMGCSQLLLGQYDEAVTRFQRTIEQAPKFFPVYMVLAWAYVELDRPGDANNTIKAILKIEPQYTLKHVARLFSYRLDEVCDRFLDSLRKAGLPEG